MSWWGDRTSWDEVCRRAAGRRRFNELRRMRKQIRRCQVAEMLIAYGPWTRGVRARIARELGVSDATVCRDAQAVLGSKLDGVAVNTAETMLGVRLKLAI